MISRLKQFLGKYFWAVCAFCIYDDFRQRLLQNKGDFSTDSGVRHTAEKIDLEGSVKYIEEVFADYKKYGKVKKFYGRIAEIGPGDNCGVALLMRAEGAKEVLLADKYFPHRDERHQNKIYQRMAESNRAIRRLLKSKQGGNFTGVKWTYGPPAAAEVFFNDKRQSFDFIVSRAVMEHLDDPIASLVAMVDALKPGGMLLHKVDLRDHGMFSNHYDELKFLRVPGWIYKLMSTASDRPNRVLVDEYEKALKNKPVKAEVLVTRLVGAGEIKPHKRFEAINKGLRAKSARYVNQYKQKLDEYFRSKTTKSLSVGGFFLVVKKNV